MGILDNIFSGDDWREELDPEIKRKMERILKRAKTYEDSYLKADHEATAQIWVALAEIYSRVERMDNRLSKIEREIVGKEEKDSVDDDMKDSLSNY